MAPVPNRPGIVTVAAILFFIFGSYSLLGGICGGVTTAASDWIISKLPPPPPAAAPGQRAQPDPWAALRDLGNLSKDEPTYVPAMVGFALASLVLGGACIYAGAGLLKMKPAARKLGIGVALSAIVLLLASYTYQAIVVIPVTNRIQEKQAKLVPGAGAVMEATTWGAVALGGAFNLAVWITIICLLCTRSARDGFAGKLASATTHEPPPGPSPYAGYEE